MFVLVGIGQVGGTAPPSPNPFMFDTPTLKSALLMNDEALSYCTSHHDTLIQEILEHRNSSITQELMTKYLYAGTQMDTKGMPGNVGYYVGTAIARDLLAQGMDLRRLTNMSGNEVIQLWERVKSCG